MRLFDYFRLAFRNFNKKKLRTFINIISIAIGVMLIVTLVSLGTGLQNYFGEKVKELYNLKQVKILPIAYQDDEELQEKLNTVNTDGEIDYKTIMKPKDIKADFIKKISSNKKVEDTIVRYEEMVAEIDVDGKKIKDPSIAYYNGKSYLKSEETSLKELNKKEKIQIPVSYIASGENLNEDSSKSVLLTEDMARVTFGIENPEEAIGKDIKITTNVADYDLSKNHEITAKIVGLIDQRFFQPSIVVSKDIMEEVKNFYLNNQVPLLERSADSIELDIKNVEDVSSVVKLIEEKEGYSTESVQTVATTINKSLIWLKLALSLVGLIVICIASLDVINTMIMSIFERTKSIGLMKSTGASNWTVLKVFLVEGGTIGLIGGLLGVGFTLGNLELIKKFISTISATISINDVALNQIVTIDTNLAIGTVVFAVILTVIASLYPALKASKLEPMDALKHD